MIIWRTRSLEVARDIFIFSNTRNLRFLSHLSSKFFDHLTQADVSEHIWLAASMTIDFALMKMEESGQERIFLVEYRYSDMDLFSISLSRACLHPCTCAPNGRADGQARTIVLHTQSYACTDAGTHVSFRSCYALTQWIRHILQQCCILVNGSTSATFFHSLAYCASS